MVVFGVLMAALVAWVQANQRDNQIASALTATQLMAVQEVRNLGAAMDGAHTVTLAGQNGYNIEGSLTGVNGPSAMVFVPFAAAWERPEMAGFDGILLLDTTGTTVQMGQSSSAPTFANNTIPQHDFAQRGVIDDAKYAAIYTHVPVFSDQISAVGAWNRAVMGPAGSTSAVFLPLVLALTGLVMSIGQGAAPKSALDASLMRDFHHQIKNNLQLISSIIRMHSRETDNAEIKDVFLRLQDRVASLATLHQDHVRDDGSGQIDIAAMLHEVIDRSERKVLCGWHLQSKTFFEVIGNLSDTVLCSACSRGA